MKDLPKPKVKRRRYLSTKFGVGRWIIYPLAFFLSVFLLYICTGGAISRTIHLGDYHKKVFLVNEETGYRCVPPQNGGPLRSNYALRDEKTGEGYQLKCSSLSLQPNQEIVGYVYKDSNQVYLSRFDDVASNWFLGAFFGLGAYYFGRCIFEQYQRKKDREVKKTR